MLSFQTILFTPYKTYLLGSITFLLCLKTESCRKIGILGRRIPCNLGKQGQDNNLIELKQRQAAMGWKLLNNEHTFLIQGNDSIALIGVENQGEPPFSQHGDLPTLNLYPIPEVLPVSNVSGYGLKVA